MITKTERTRNGYSAPTGLEVERINPALGKKYSPNLYEFLTARKNSSQLRLARIFIDTDGTEYLGFMDDTNCLIGARLTQVLCYGTKAQVLSYCNTGDLRERVGFWDEYIADGRCAIDREHKMPFIGAETRWRVVGEQRHCQWCNKATQTLQRTVKQVTVESWTTAPAI